MAVFRVKEPFSFDVDGVPVTVKRGALLEEGHPWVAGHEQYMEPAEDAAQRSAGTTPQAVETATAAPGERRTRGKSAQ